MYVLLFYIPRLILQSHTKSGPRPIWYGGKSIEIAALDWSTGSSSQGFWLWFSEKAGFSLHFLFFISSMNHITKQLYSIIRCTTPPEATPPSRLPGLCPRPHTLSSPSPLHTHTLSSPSPLHTHPSPLFGRPKHNQRPLGRCAFPSPLSHTLTCSHT